jgi:hypothetical protein
MAYGLLGEKEAAAKALERMNETAPGYDPINTLRRFNATDETIEAATDAMHRAGWQGGNAQPAPVN